MVCQKIHHPCGADSGWNPISGSSLVVHNGIQSHAPIRLLQLAFVHVLAGGWNE